MERKSSSNDKEDTMKKTYKRPDIYKESMGSECMAPVVLSNQSIGGNVNPIGGEGNPDDGGDANIYQRSLWDEE
jgi:hypothetical protein